MDIRKRILKLLKQKGSVRVADVVRETGFSRAYVHRCFQQLRGEGILDLIGKANQARYLPASAGASRSAKREVRELQRILTNRNLSEDVVLREIKSDSGIFFRLRPNVVTILDYAFTEMLNNAIEHSGSEKIFVWMKRTHEDIRFRVRDRGIGVFKNIMKTRGLANELEAIQDLIKGKQTTDPSRHSGEGIFFTSKVADLLVIKGSTRKLIFDNRIPDVFVEASKLLVGTDVQFSIHRSSRKELQAEFAHYAGDAFEFSKTEVTVKLFKTKESYVSRSQARRILTDLEKFKTIVLDFKGVSTVGQAFADEIFRVWLRVHPGTEISVRNANEEVRFMIRHVRNA